LRAHFFACFILSAETYCYNWSGRQDSNLRPSAPKALNSFSAAQGFQAIANFLLNSAW